MGIIADSLPLTGYADFAKASATDVRAAIGKLCRELHVEQTVKEGARAARTLRAAIRFLDPAADQLMRCIVLNTRKAGWVAVFNDVIGGHALDAFLANRLKTDAVGFRLAADTARRQGRGFVGEFGEVRLEVYVRGQRTREIAAWNDLGKWRFGHEGKPLPFEEVRAYKAARARDRFTPAMLLRYLAALGLHPFDDDFFVVDARRPAQSVTITWKSEDNEPVALADLRERSGLTPEVIADLLGSEARTPKRRKSKR